MSAMNVYEVELLVTNKNTKAASIVVRTEHAYGVMDAVMQAVCNQSAAVETGSADIVVRHIGPPESAILRAAAQVAEDVALAMHRVCSGVPK